jgi:YHS domain-containing protein
MIKTIAAMGLAVSVMSGPLTTLAADQKTDVKPYKLQNCIVSDEKLGEMGEPFVFDYQGQQIKLCCKSCKKDFDKNPDKYMKKLAKAEKAKPSDKAGQAAPNDHSTENHSH